jgi:hypothetical protein
MRAIDFSNQKTHNNNGWRTSAKQWNNKDKEEIKTIKKEAEIVSNLRK